MEYPNTFIAVAARDLPVLGEPPQAGRQVQDLWSSTAAVIM